MIEIRQIDGLNYQGVMEICAEGWLDLLRRGVANDTVLLGWEHKAFVAEEDGKLIGILTYEHIDWTRSWSVVLGYVRPEHRGKGVYRALWQALVAKAREAGRHHIDGCVSVKNAEMLETMNHLGRTLHSLSYRFDL